MGVFHLLSKFHGEFAALGAAFLWATASILYGRLGHYFSPLQLNLLKNAIAIVMIGALLLPGGILFSGIDFFAVMMLLLSGAIGIGIGDTAFFGALKRIGARRTLLIQILAPPISGLLALIFMGEKISMGAWLGMGLTVAGVGWVITERIPGAERLSTAVRSGVSLALMAAVGQAVGAVLSHAVFMHADVDSLRSALLRLIGGTLILLIGIPIQPHAAGLRFAQMRSLRLWTLILFTVFIGTFLGLWLQQASLKYTAAGIAQTLLATSPLFVLPIAVRMGERVSLRAILGASLSVLGVALLFGWQ